MATKKSESTKSTNDDSILNKMATAAGHVAGELIVAKNQVVEKAADVIDKVKSTVKKITGNKKAAPKKAAKVVLKKAAKKTAPIKKAAKKEMKKIAKKAAPIKKAAKSTVKKIVRKVAPAKKAVKKAAKKVTGGKK